MNLWNYLRFARSAPRALLLRDSWKKAGRVDVLMISADSKRGELTRDGRRFNRLLDTLGLLFEREGVTSLHLSRPPSVLTTDKLWARSATFNRLYFSGLVLDFFFGRLIGDHLRFQRAAFGRILNRTQPRLVLAEESRGYMWQACQSRNIPLVEVLHGLGYPDLSRTPTFSREPSEGLPPAIASFDPTSSDSWMEITGGKGGLINLRNFWVEEFRKDKSSPGIKELLDLRSMNTEGYEYKILVSLSWSYGSRSKKSQMPDWKLLDLPLGLLEAIETLGDRAFWMIRLHPAQVNSLNPHLSRQTQFVEGFFDGKTNVDVKNATTAPLPHLLNIATHHITSKSMAAFEAAAHAVPTLSAAADKNLNLAARFSLLIETGFLTLLGDSKFLDIESWVKSGDRVSSSLKQTSFGVMPSFEAFLAISRGNETN